MTRWAQLVQAATGRDDSHTPGAGAAGEPRSARCLCSGHDPARDRHRPRPDRLPAQAGRDRPRHHRDRWTRRACKAPIGVAAAAGEAGCPFSRWRDAVCSTTLNYATPEFAWHTRSPSWSPTFTNRSRMQELLRQIGRTIAAESTDFPTTNHQGGS